MTKIVDMNRTFFFSLQNLLSKIKDYFPDKEVVYLAREKIVEYILGFIQTGDLVITLGAGDIVKVSDELAKELK